MMLSAGVRRSGGRAATSAGTNLVECVLAMALVALVLPVVVLALGQSHRDLARGRAEAWAGRSIPACLSSLRMAGGIHDGHGRIWAHDRQGRVLGAWSAGTWRLEETPEAAYLVVADCPEVGGADVSGVSPLALRLEYPAAAPAKHRRVLSFHTRMTSCLP